MNTKTETYIGFAIKRGSVVFGCDEIKRYRKKVYLILATESLSANSLKDMQKAAEVFGCKVLIVPDYGILTARNCKAVAICYKSLADAIQKESFNVKLEEKNGKHNK